MAAAAGMPAAVVTDVVKVGDTTTWGTEETMVGTRTCCCERTTTVRRRRKDAEQEKSGIRKQAAGMGCANRTACAGK